MAQVGLVDEGTFTDAYMPFPLATRHEVAFQWVQMFVPIVGGIAAIAYTSINGMSVGTLAVTFLFSALTGLGITVGFHRLFTHRSFETVPSVRAALAIFGAMAAQGTLFSWVSSHRQHHRFSDEHGDPHSPNVSGRSAFSRFVALMHSHFGWMLTGHMTSERLHYIPDLLADPMLCRIQRLHFVWVAIGFVLPPLCCYAIAGTAQAAIEGLLWGGFLRIFITDQISFAVNSVGHVWGKRPYDSHDLSRNNGLVALLSFGEGWHNNHHAFPTSARHGLHWWQFDASYNTIQLLEWCGLAWNVKTPTAAQLATKVHGVAAETPVQVPEHVS